MKRFGLFCAAMCLVAGFATACGGSSNSTQEPATGTATLTASPSGTAEATTSGPAATSAATITIANMNFGEPITVSPGAQITIKNNDSAEHSVTSDAAGKFDVEVEGNEQGTLTAPTEPGEYAFHCTYHPSMHGTLTVK
jgi:plastocyanin